MQPSVTERFKVYNEPFIIHLIKTASRFSMKNILRNGIHFWILMNNQADRAIPADVSSLDLCPNHS